MSERVKNIVISILFIAIIFSVCIINIVLKDKDISISERRTLKQFPKLNATNILNGNFNDELETYAMDQFLLRDNMRSIKTIIKLDILKQMDNNDLFIQNGIIYKLLYPLNEKSILNISNKMNYIYNKYLANNTNIYYTIIPDKNYFLDDNTKYLKLNYSNLENMLKENVNSNFKYIDICNSLTIDNYYRTDTHWKQEDILETAKIIADNMNIKDKLTEPFNKKEYTNSFYGAYYGQLGKNISPDSINYLTNDIIENAKSYNYETQKEAKVYDIDKANSSMDKYDLFLSGATPLIEIQNSNATQEKELVIFRDSFASSIAPLFTQAYSKIILVDTRYISSDILEDYIEFNENQDILFMYSTLIINDSGALK